MIVMHNRSGRYPRIQAKVWLVIFFINRSPMHQALLGLSVFSLQSSSGAREGVVLVMTLSG